MRTLSFLFFALFIFISFFYRSPWALESVDEAGIRFALTHRTLWLDSFLTDYSGLGAPPATATISVIAFILFVLKKQTRLAQQLAFTMGGILIWSPLLKHIFARSRPSEAFRLIKVTGYSFPSGHALDSTSLYVCLTLLAFSYYQKRNEQIILSGFCAFILFWISLSRVYLGVHYPLDVLAGISFGLGWVFMIHNYFARKFASAQQQSRAPGRENASVRF